MKSHRPIGLFLLFAFSPLALSEPSAETPSLEVHERNIDRAAIQSQKQAIAQLEKLVKKYQGQSQEPTLLLKLAELYQEISSMEFRVSAYAGFVDHANGHAGKKKSVPMNHPSLQKAVSTLRVLIAKFPNHPEADRAYYLRGKSLEELGQKSGAAQDYLKTVHSYPDSPFVAPAYMSLAEFAIEENLHDKAVGYLEKVEQQPADPRYPFALYKLAWSHFNLKNIPQSLKYIEKHIRFYQDKSPEHKTQSDIALLENSLQDLPTFYFEGYERGMPAYSIEDAYDRFKEIEKGPAFGKMLLKFAKLLRSHSHEKDLFAWQKQIFEREPKRPETVDVVTVAFEYAINRKLYEQWPSFSRNIVQLSRLHQNSPSLDQARKLLLETAEALQPQIIKNKDANDIQRYSQVLAGLYESYISTLTSEKDPRVGRVHYNLAETFFAVKEYAKATEHYRWTAENMPPEHRLDSEIKAVSSRYQELIALKLVPSELKAAPMNENSDDKLPELLATWLKWLDQANRGTKAKDTARKELIAKFYLEASRALYGQKHLKDALSRMQAFIQSDPSQDSAVAMATLTLDTWIVTQDWPQTEAYARDFLKIKSWKSPEFPKKLQEILVDAKFKQLENRFTQWARLSAEENAIPLADLLDDVDEFSEKFPSSPRRTDLMVLSGNAALKSGQRKRALGYYNALIAESSAEGATQSQALIARAALEEESYHFEKAAQDYLAIFKKTTDAGGKSELIKKKILQLAWLSGSVPLQKQAFENQKICPKDAEAAPAMKLDCQHLEAMIAFQTASQSTDYKTAFEKARKIIGPAKSVWATVALRESGGLPYRDRNLLIRLVSMGWKELDPLTQYVISSELIKSIPIAFQQNKESLATVAPLRATERHITHRIDVIRELENAATAALGLPWINIRESVMHSMAEIYAEFSKEIMNLKAEEGLSAEDLAVYRETVNKIAEPFSEKGKELASQADKLSRVPQLSAKIHWSADFLAKLDPESNWSAANRQVASSKGALELENGEETRPQMVRALWMRAFTRNDLPVMGFVLQESQTRRLFSEKSQSVIRAASLARIGAYAEAAAEEAVPENLIPQSVALISRPE